MGSDWKAQVTPMTSHDTHSAYHTHTHKHNQLAGEFVNKPVRGQSIHSKN